MAIGACDLCILPHNGDCRMGSEVADSNGMPPPGSALPVSVGCGGVAHHALAKVARTSSGCALLLTSCCCRMQPHHCIVRMLSSTRRCACTCAVTPQAQEAQVGRQGGSRPRSQPRAAGSRPGGLGAASGETHRCGRAVDDRAAGICGYKLAMSAPAGPPGGHAVEQGKGACGGAPALARLCVECTIRTIRMHHFCLRLATGICVTKRDVEQRYLGLSYTIAMARLSTPP